MGNGKPSVSRREDEVLAALADRLTNAEIADRLHISTRTVESHVASLLRKFGAESRRKLAVMAATRDGGRAVVRPGAIAIAGLPAAWTSFVGRESECGAAIVALNQGRLVTLMGPGGVGKTRLAVVVAEAVEPSIPSGGAFVDLVPVSAGFVVQAVAAALGVVERQQQPLEETVCDRLRRGRSLLVLDNCEHVLDAVAVLVERLLAACPEAVILTTSRERLGVAGERVITVPPLSFVSADTGEAKGSDAVTLFFDRARDADPDFDADPNVVAEVCARLSGMPLAIELAAARCSSLGIDGLLAGLVDYFRLLTSDRPASDRHRSLRAVVDWSHDLLDDDERAAFRHLGVFVGGFDLEAAAAVAVDDGRVVAADLVGRLADKNLLVRRRTPRGSRWRLLELVRVYALERLKASGEETEIRRRHLTWAASMASNLERRLDPREAWRDDFDMVADDLRAALENAGPGPRPNGDAHRLAVALGHLAYARGFLFEARHHYQEAATRAPDDTAAAANLRTAAAVAYAEILGDEAFELLLAAAERSKVAGDWAAYTTHLADAAVLGYRSPSYFSEPVSNNDLSRLVYTARAAVPSGNPVIAAHVTSAMAWHAAPARATADSILARQALELARQVADPVLISGGLDALTSAAIGEGRFRDAARLTRQRLDLLDLMPGHDPRVGGEIVETFHMATEMAIAAGDLSGALAVARRAQLDSIGQGLPQFATSRLVLPLALRGDFDDALVEGQEMIDGWERAGRPAAEWMAAAVYAVALIRGLRGDRAGFEEWAGLARQLGQHRTLRGFGCFVDLRVALHTGRIDDELFTATPEPPFTKFDAYALAASAEAAVVVGVPDAAERIDAASSAGTENDWAAACLARAAGRLRGDRDLLMSSIAKWECVEARFERACTLLLVPDGVDEGRAELDALGCPLPA